MNPRFAQIKAYYSIQFDQYDMDFHRHPRMEIMYVQSGECTVALEKREFRLKPGQLIFLLGDVYHRLVISPGAPCHVINLEFSMDEPSGIPVEEFFSSCCGPEEFAAHPYSLCYDSFRLGFALKDLLFELDLGAENPYTLKVLFHRMLIELTRCLRQNDTPSGLLYTRKAAEFIRKNFDTQLSVGDVAAHVRINDAYLQTLFKKQMGCSIITYINNLRIQKAQFLLKNTGMDITDVAFAVGFNSRQHFGYSFKKACGCSPLAFRQESNRDIQILTDPYFVDRAPR